MLFVRETVRELGERRASGFLKKFYGWYLGRGRFPKEFKQELLQLDSTEEVERRLLAAAPGAFELVERLEAEVPSGAELTLELPVSIYGGGYEHLALPQTLARRIQESIRADACRAREVVRIGDLTATLDHGGREPVPQLRDPRRGAASSDAEVRELIGVVPRTPTQATARVPGRAAPRGRGRPRSRGLPIEGRLPLLT